MNTMLSKALRKFTTRPLKTDPTATKITPPLGACIHTLRVKVQLDRPWDEAINLAGPNTPSDCNARKAGGLYVPTGAGEIEKELILLNYPKGNGTWDMALAWAQTQSLKKTVPRDVFAVGEQHPRLHKKLWTNPMRVVATTDCSFGGFLHACYVWWGASRRKVNLYLTADLVDPRVWFAFSK